MSDPIQNFEFILKNSTKRPISLYNDNKKYSKHSLKPQDVISSVSLQIKAIHVADSSKSDKCVGKDLKRYNKSTFLSVNKLPVYEKVPKQTTKFDTQCVSDTQLISVIEDAEIIDVHRGITQEFETTFCHFTEKQNTNEQIEIHKQDIDTGKNNIVNENNDDREVNNIGTALSVISPIMCSNNTIDEGAGTDTQEDNILDSALHNQQIFDKSLVIQDDLVIRYEKDNIHSSDIKKHQNAHAKDKNQLLNNSIEIIEEIENLVERPPSPILIHKHVKTKSKTPSPLIFNLERFEKFEQIAVPIVESNDLMTARHVINSQILDKEFHLNMNEDAELNETDLKSPLLDTRSLKKPQTIDSKTDFVANEIKTLDSDIDLGFIELDKATSDDLINKIMNDDTKSHLITKSESEVLQDEILFSSDEENDYVHKSYQDLPFTCALETSFYEQSDVLDKTMYVGFQTASNKTIQVFTDSFAQAKSMLSDVDNDEITVTDMVNNCDSIVKKTEGENNQGKTNLDGEKLEFNLEEQQKTNFADEELDYNLQKQVKMNLEREKIELNLGQEYEIGLETLSKNKKPEDTIHDAKASENFEGFMTASKKVIKLSQRALARCKKVFQDIDLNEQFDEENSDGALVIAVESHEAKRPAITDVTKSECNKRSLDEDIQTIDDVILQEFENIEMSLKEDKEMDVDAAVKRSGNDIQISESETIIKDIFKDIDFDEDLHEENTNKNVKDLDSISENVDLKLGGFKTASNKNINISKEALSKTKNIFQNIDSTEFPNKSKHSFDKINDLEQASTSKATFVAFKTANNKDIKISDQALQKTKNIFKDLDAIEFPNISDKIVQDDINEECFYNEPSTSKTEFIGFKTANNKAINITKNALAKTKKIFEGIDTEDFKFPTKNNKDVFNENCEISKSVTDLKKPSTSKSSFEGFKTANNKQIKISDAALAKSINIFKDIDSTDFDITEIEKDVGALNVSKTTILPKVPFVGFKTANNKEIKISDIALTKTKNMFKDIELGDSVIPIKENMTPKINHKNDKNIEMIDSNNPVTKTVNFTGFKTANNKKINISKEAMAKSVNIFKDIDSNDFKIPEKYKTEIVKSREETAEMNDKEFNQHSISKFVGSKTANNKKITISEESLAKTKNIFKDTETTDFGIPEKSKTRPDKIDGEYKIIDFNQPSTSKATFVGFKTANNRNITITEESLVKTRNIFKDIDYNDFVNPKEDESLIETVSKDEAKPDQKKSIPSASFEGFKTANNKIINISETALAQTKEMFKYIDASEFQVPEKNKEDYPNIEIDGRQIHKDFDVSVTTAPKFQGFQTASNKQVKVSADALIISKKILENINVIDDFKTKIANFEDTDAIFTENNLINNNQIPKSNNVPSDKTSPVFKGFRTANKKPVAISKEALAKSKKVFQDMETIQVDDDPEPEFYGFKSDNDVIVAVSAKDPECSTFKGFQTANDKKVHISEDSLAKSRKIFLDIENEENFNNDNKKKHEINISSETAKSKRFFSDIDDVSDATPRKKDKITENISNLIDTQVLNNFDESLHTEDFRDTPVKSKRSGSPILSCPRAKKRKKFETPYSQKLPKLKMKNEFITPKNVNKITFTENYKQTKKYALKDLSELSKNRSTKTDPYLLKFNFDNLLKFEFHADRNFETHGVMTIDLLKELFINSVNSKLIPNGWLENHIKLILWKLISYEIKFNSAIRCSAKNVIDQLKYRYDRELYNAQRPALRKILEKDDVASKTIVLCVAGVFADGVSVTSATITNNIELLLTDGWYCIKASIDKMLAQLVCQGKIVVGTKIVTTGAELVNCELGISPWEDTSAVRLKIFGNSTRRARWDARLGYHSNGAILSQLSSVKLDGGKVSKLRVFVTRVYPALYVEKFEDGSTVTRSERLEHLHQMKTEADRQTVMEKIYEEVEKEFSDQESQDCEGLSASGNKRICLDSGSQIAKVMKRSRDPAEFRAGLTSSQSRLLEAHTSKHREVVLQNIQKRIQEKMETAGVSVSRNVVTLLKIRVAGITDRNGVEVTKGMISIWKPTDAVLEIIKEGVWIDVMNVVPTAVRYSEIQISAGRQSIFSISKYKEPENFKPYTKLLKRSCFTIKDLAQNPSKATEYNEIDTAGFIFLIDPSIIEFDSAKQPFQNVYLADADKNIICVNFWGGLKKFGFQNVLDTGQIVACANLQKRAGNTRKSIPQFRVTEFSHFTKTPKNENARNLLESLNKKFFSLDRRKFCEDCVVLKNNFAVIKQNNENISPYRFNNNDFNISKNKIFIDSPLARPNKVDDTFNLTGLDFESTFRQTEQLPEEVLLRKKKVNEKIARLKMYGEPPPLSTIHIINKSKNASKSYKSPLLSNNSNKSKIENHKPISESANAVNSKSDSSINVASVGKTPEKWESLNESVACSPVLNRTYVKSVNPVKLNFDLKDNNDSSVDHFAEEFDSSPPLSLD